MTKREQHRYHVYMDPKGGQILDPKLKEAYDRVMGASIPQAAPKPPSPPPPPAHPEPAAMSSPPHADTPKTPEHHDATPAPTTHVAPPPPTGHAPTAPAQNPQSHAGMSFSNGYVAPHPEKKGPVSGPLLIIAGVIFLAVYTLFWMKWFGMEIPFLP